ncbi:MAG TPA: MBL fold metallo-hydrolase [archaeon]|nr:MBL fold metallo-hydrolase [archaeon]
MDRRHFFTLSGVSLAAACSAESPKTVPGGVTGEKESSLTEGRFFPPVVQQGPMGHKVIHDRMTYIEQYKYDNWKPGQNYWKDDAELWKDFSWKWGNGTLPMQHRPMQVLEGLYLLGPADYQQNIYLWDTGTGLLIVDPSYERFRPMIETQIRQLGYRLADIKWVLLTHMHYDHAESAAAWEKRGAPIYIHTDDADYVTGKKKVMASDIAEPVAEPVTFSGGEELAFGNLRMVVIHTPGHTPGSSCFSLDWQGTGVLISGDIVLDFGRHAWMGADYCDWDQYLASLWKLYEYPKAKTWQVLLPGHSTVDLEGALDNVYKVLQVTSEIIRQRRAGGKIDWIDPYEFFWKRRIDKEPEIEPLRS